MGCTSRSGTNLITQGYFSSFQIICNQILLNISIGARRTCLTVEQMLPEDDSHAQAPINRNETSPRPADPLSKGLSTMNNYGIEVILETENKKKGLFCYSYSQQDVPRSPEGSAKSKAELYLEQVRLQLVNISCIYRKTNHWFFVNNSDHIDRQLATQVIQEAAAECKRRGRRVTVLELDQIKKMLSRDQFEVADVNRELYEAIADNSIIDLNKNPYGVLSTQLFADSHVHIIFFNGAKEHPEAHQLVVKTLLLGFMKIKSYSVDKVNVDLSIHLAAMQNELAPNYSQ